MISANLLVNVDFQLLSDSVLAKQIMFLESVGKKDLNNILKWKEAKTIKIPNSIGFSVVRTQNFIIGFQFGMSFA